MKILFVTYCRAMLGANLSMLGLIKDLKERYAVESTVLMSDVIDGDLATVLETEGIPYIVSPMKHWVIDSQKSLRYVRGFYNYLQNQKYLANLLFGNDLSQFDIIYTNNSTVVFGSYLAEKLKKPHIWHIREFGTQDYDYAYSYPEVFIRRRLSLASKVVTISQVLNSYIKDTIGKSANTVMIYNGIQNNHVLKESWNTNTPVQFVIVGALSEGKNQLDILKAAKYLLTNFSSVAVSGFHIHIIGNGTDYEAILKQYVTDNELNNYITFHGYCKDANAMLDSMDVGVICSKAEAFGRVTCEYMFASMPVIGSNSGATPELLETNKTGYLYKPDTPEDLAKYMLMFINDHSLIKEFGTNAYNEATLKYTIISNTDSIYKLLTSVLP